MSEKKKTLLLSAFILTGTSLLLRAVGMFFRIFISNKIGAEGMGLHQLIYSVYMLATTIATSGISMAVTRLVAEELGKGTRQSIRKILYRAISLGLLLSLGAAAMLYWGAEPIGAFWLKDDRTVLSLQILAPSLPFIAVSSVLKGYFTAQEKVVRTSFSQILEQLVRMGVIFYIMDRFLPMGVEYACGAVMIGTTVSEIASCLYLWLHYRRDWRSIDRQGLHPTEGGIVKKILEISVPIAVRSWFRSGLHALENILIPAGLQRHGATGQASLEQYGMLKGMAMPILFFPSSFLTAFSTLLVSELATAGAQGQQGKVTEVISHVLRLTFLFSIFTAGIFLFFAYDLGIFIYRERAVGSMIRFLAPLVPFMYLESIVDGMLTALNEQVSTMKYNLMDGMLRIVLICLLLPMWGMGGFLAVMFVSNLFTSLLSMFRLLKVTGLSLQTGGWIGKPLLATALAGSLAVLLERSRLMAGIPSILVFCCSLGMMGLVFFAVLFLLGCITKEDISWVKAAAKRGC